MIKVIRAVFGIQYYYFVSYDYNAGTKYGKGNTEVVISSKIKSIKDIDQIERKIMRELNYEKVKINNFIRLK